MNLKNKKWKIFIIGEIFDEIINSKAYHKNQLNTSYKSKFPYITRTKQNNGLELFVNSEKKFNKNPENTIVFGAESGTFFYEPFEYITGNKMYFIKDIHFNKYNCLFLVSILNNVGEKFGYSLGLTASRLKNERIMLPVNEKGEPDYEFMSEYMKNIEKEQIKKYTTYLKKLEDTDSNTDRGGGN